MSLIKCPECGKEFSEFANECPVCGMPISKIKELKNSENTENANLQKNVNVRTFSKLTVWKIVGSIIVFIFANIVLLDDAITVSFGGLLLLNAILCYAIGFILTNFKKAFLFLAGVLVLMLFHKIIPVIDNINSIESHEERYAIYFLFKSPIGDVEALNPTKDYICNKTGRTLYLTSIGYGKYQYEPNKYTTIPNNSIVEGNVYSYFEEPSNTTIIRRGHPDGVWRNFLHYKKL